MWFQGGAEMKIPTGQEVAGPGRKLLRSRQEAARQEAGRKLISWRILAPAQAGGRQELDFCGNSEAVAYCLRQLASAWGPGRKFWCTIIHCPKVWKTKGNATFLRSGRSCFGPGRSFCGPGRSCSSSGRSLGRMQLLPEAGGRQEVNSEARKVPA